MPSPRPNHRRQKRSLTDRARALSVRGRILLALAVAALLASGFHFTRTGEEAVHPQRGDSRRFALAEERLRSEPNVANVVYAPERGSWNVELPPKATVAAGFAGYLCAVLAGEQMVDRRTSVRTVDSVKLAKAGFDYEAATIEHVRCRSVIPQAID